MQYSFQNEIFKILKMFKGNMEFSRATCWINSKLSNKDKNATLMIFLFCDYCWSLLWCNYWRCLMLWNSTCWSHLKLTVQINTACSLSMQPIFTIWLVIVLKNSVLLCWILNCKQNLDSKCFIDSKTCYILLSLWIPLPARLVLLKILAYPSSKRVIYGPQLNL